ncbi:hypothetical protein AB4Y32_29585 [Paraburkholderia phymatum]|uniref:Uncharacterized protein n=1 Tax=Paraburkholderia phymatum TaxID=148447 RepID=A0ACC6U883_9BURK
MKISGGFATQNVTVGDVLVSTQIVDYELQKIEPGRTAVRPSYPPISQRLLQASLNFQDRSWVKSLKSRPSPGEPQVHFGPVASGDKVINDAQALQRLIDLHPKLVGVEMEAGGAAAASHQHETNFFMVRGVSDLADGQKGNSAVLRWRQYASEVAAAYAVGLVRSGLLAPPGPRELRNSYEDVSEAIAATAKTMAMVDKLAGPVEFLLTGKDKGGAHRVQYEGAGIELVAKEHGAVIQTITGQDLQRLPAEQLRHIRVRERTLESYYAVWEDVHPQLPLMSDPMAKARVTLQLKQTVSDMKTELDAIFRFLTDCGLYLDDHYQRF